MGVISNIDAAISHVGTNRTNYAAVMNRLDHAMANMKHIDKSSDAEDGLRMLILRPKVNQPCKSTGPSASIYGNVSTSECCEAEHTSLI